MSDNQPRVPKEDYSTFRLLECVFPDGVHEQDYLPLLSIFVEDMSFRSAAHVAGLILGKDYTMTLTDVYRAASSSYVPDPSLKEAIRQRLLDCGYRAWLEEET